MANKPKKLSNPILDPFNLVRTHKFVEVACLPIYASKTGGKTNDVDLAELDPFGKPIQLGFTEESVAVITKSPTPICFDPKDNNARLRAFQSRAALHDALPPNVYADKFQALSEAHNLSNRLVTKFNNLNTSNTDE